MGKENKNDNLNHPAETPGELWEMSELALKDATGKLTADERQRFHSLGLGLPNSGPNIIIMQNRGTDLDVSYGGFKPNEAVPGFFPEPKQGTEKPEKGSGRIRKAFSWISSRLTRRTP